MLCVRQGRVSLRRFYHALIVEMAGHMFCIVVHIIQLMLSTDRYMYRSYKWFISNCGYATVYVLYCSSYNAINAVY